jgi:hypothetical protein
MPDYPRSTLLYLSVAGLQEVELVISKSWVACPSRVSVDLLHRPLVQKVSPNGFREKNGLEDEARDILDPKIPFFGPIRDCPDCRGSELLLH